MLIFLPFYSKVFMRLLQLHKNHLMVLKVIFDSISPAVVIVGDFVYREVYL
jgi:hypothetical protein